MFRIVSLLITLSMIGGAVYGRKYFIQHLVDTGKVPEDFDPLEAFNKLEALGGGKVQKGDMSALQSMMGFGSEDKSSSSQPVYEAKEPAPPAEVHDNPFFD